MAEIRWASQALDELDDIHLYIAADSPFHAEKTITSIFAHTRLLVNNPFAGRRVQEGGSSAIRELIEGRYRIIYEVISNDEIVILSVYHTARKL